MTALVPEEGPLENIRNAIQILKGHGGSAHPAATDAVHGAIARLERAVAQLEAKPPAPGIPMAAEPSWEALKDDENGRGLTRVGGFLEPVDRPKFQRMLNAWRRGYHDHLRGKMTSDNPYLMQTFQQPVMRAWKEGWSACKADLTRGHQPVDLQDRCAAWGVLE